MSQQSRPIRVLMVDDHALMRGGIAGLIAGEPDMTLVAEAGTGRDAIEQFRRHHPDVTLMDLRMPEMSGLQALSAIRAEVPDARVIVLTTYSGDVQVGRALRAGASAYLQKNTLRHELLDAIRAVHAGRKMLSPEVSFDLAEHVGADALSPAEIRVLRLVANGQSNREIAATLAVTEDTIKCQIRSILAKLGANDRTHAVVIGLKRGIIEY
jgi:DNA-binding NarL/FixJ family response regulator